MIFRVTLKDPDALYEAINDALEDELAKMDEEEADAIHDIRLQKIQEIAEEWFEYGEVLTVEIDTINKTCSAVKVSEL